MRLTLILLNNRSTNLRHLVKTGWAQSSEQVSKTFTDLVNTVNDRFGINEMEEARQRITQAKDAFEQFSKKRLNTNEQLLRINKELNGVRERMNNFKKGDERHFELVTQEYDLMRQEQQLMSEFDQVIEQEQLAFDQFSSRLRESYELEQVRNTKLRVYNLILSLLYAAVTGLITALSLMGKFVFENKILTKLQSIEKNVDQVLVRSEQQDAALKQAKHEVKDAMAQIDKQQSAQQSSSEDSLPKSDQAEKKKKFKPESISSNNNFVQLLLPYLTRSSGTDSTIITGQLFMKKDRLFNWLFFCLLCIAIAIIAFRQYFG